MYRTSYVLRLPLILAALGLAPSAARAQISVVNSAVQERQAAAGESYAGTIRLRNHTAEPQEVRAYLTDYAFQADGSTVYGQPGSGARSNAAWVTLSPARATLAPGGETEIGYRVSVPAGAARRGTYWSMVMVEPVARGTAESSQGAPGRKPVLGVETRVRYGVQVATHVGTDGARQVEFAAPRATGAAQGARSLEFDLVNTGDLAYRPTLQVELFDAEGNPAGRFQSERGLLYPGTSLRQRFELGALPAGSYQALVTADTGGESVFGAKYQLRL